MSLKNVPPLPQYPFCAGLFSQPTKTTVAILMESFSKKVVVVVADNDITKYPHEIQVLIRKVRIYFQNNDSINGVKNMMEEIEEYLYQQKLEQGGMDSVTHWWIVNEFQKDENLTPIERMYRGVMRGEKVKIL